MRPPSRPAKHRAPFRRIIERGIDAFSLVELLVVIAIVAILAALLIPGISSIGERAKRVKCLANMRQIGVGLRGYGADHENFGPPDNRHTGNSSVSSFRSGASLFLFGPLLEYLDCPNVNKYLTSTSTVPDVFVCPSSRADLLAAVKSPIGCESTSYWFNPDVSWNPQKANKLFALPQQTIVCMDTCLWWQYTPEPWAPECHNTIGFNFLRLDGSAGWMSKKQTVGIAAGWNFPELSKL